MKYLPLFTLCGLLLTSCGPSAADTRQKMKEMMEGEGANYLSHRDIVYWNTIIEGCGDDAECLEFQYDKLLDQVAERKVESEVQKQLEQ